MSELKLVIASAFAAAASALSALACTLVEFYNPVLFEGFCSIPDDVQIYFRFDGVTWSRS